MLRSAVLAVAFTAGLASAASASTQQYHAQLNSKSEVPPTTSNGTGTFTGSLDTTSRVLTYTLSFNGLSGPATAAHIHGPASKTTNAGVIAPLSNGSGPLTSPVNGTVTLTPEQVKDLRAGKDYVNVHTDANKGGEIRGMILHGPTRARGPSKSNSS